MFARQYLITVAAQVSQALLGLISLIALARILEPADFGTFALLTALVTIIGVATTAGVQAALLVFAARYERRRAEIHGQALLVAILVGAIVAGFTTIVGPLVARGLSPDLATVVVLLAAIRVGPSIYTSLLTTELSGAGQIGAMAALNAVGGATSILGPVGAAVASRTLLGAVAGGLAGSVVWALVAFSTGLRLFGLRLRTDRAMWRGVIGMAIPLQIGTAAYWIMLRADAFILNAMVGGAVVGVYALALSLSDRVSFITTPLYNATAWRVSGTGQASGLATTIIVTRLEVLAGLVLSLAVVLLGGPLISVLAGPAYAPAALPLAILVIGTALLPVWASLGLFLVSHAQGSWMTARLQVAAAAAAVVGYLLVIPALGMIGAALVSTAAYIGLVAAGLRAVRRYRSFSLAELIPGPADLLAVARALRAAVRPRSAR